ncbi:MAG: M23 family metallopeptidase, partial [Parasporobacterium sp.]|nr:M23 family metallopeptidase [Parasporobacterium sp.]
LKAIEELEAEQEVQKAVMAEAAAVKEAELAEVYAEAYELQELIDTLGSEISANEERINEIIASYDQEQGITVEEYTYSGNGVFLWPLPSPYLSDHISSTFGYRYDEDVLATGASDFHSGLDIWAPEGVPILAVADGVVVADFYSSGIGNVIAIYHGDGIFTECHHMSAFGGFTTGDHVSQGDVIGYVGCTGQYSTGNHLHFGVCTGDSSWALASNYVNPLLYIG